MAPLRAASVWCGILDFPDEVIVKVVPVCRASLITPLDSTRPEGMAHYMYERQRTGDEPLASGQAHRSREAGSPLLETFS